MSGTPPAAVETVAAYVRSLPKSVQDVAKRVRAALRGALPEAREAIRYKMPAYLVDGKSIVYFSVWKKHVGVYPVYPGSATFEAAVAAYRSGKDTVRFPLDQPVPYALIARVAKHQRSQAPGKAQAKAKARSTHTAVAVASPRRVPTSPPDSRKISRK